MSVFVFLKFLSNFRGKKGQFDTTTNGYARRGSADCPQTAAVGFVKNAANLDHSRSGDDIELPQAKKIIADICCYFAKINDDGAVC